MYCREEKYDQLNGALEMILSDKGYITMSAIHAKLVVRSHLMDFICLAVTIFQIICVI